MSDLHNSDTEAPGGVYLCQVNERISCGACCGLYNVADPTFDALKDLLLYRTEVFESLDRDMDAIVAYQEKIQQKESDSRPMPEFHHCPFLGLVGEGGLRVGCLLHPLGHGSKEVDLRGLSFYGGMACRVYFCPAHYGLPAAVKEIVREAAMDWHIYGLVITETEMLNAFFQEVEGRIHRPVNKDDILDHANCLDAIRAFFDLKITWPYRNDGLKGLHNYFFQDNLYPRPSVDYGVAGGRKSKHDVIFRELGSRFFSASQLREAENLVDGIVDRLATAISSNIAHPAKALHR